MTDPGQTVPIPDEELTRLLSESRRTAKQHMLVVRLIAEVQRLRAAVRERDRLLDRAAQALLRANR